MDIMTSIVVVVCFLSACFTVICVKSLAKQEHEAELEQMLIKANMQIAEYRRQELVKVA